MCSFMQCTHPKKPNNAPSLRGFTLVELLVVVGVVVILLGISSAAYVGMRENLVLPGVVERVVGALRAARTTAVSERDQAAVEFYVGADNKHYMVSYGLRTVAMFHFDGDGKDAKKAAGLGQAGTLEGFVEPVPTVPGKFGDALHFDGQSCVTAGPSGLFDLSDGVSISAYLRPQVTEGGVALDDGVRLPVLGKFADGSGMYALYLIYSKADNAFRLAASVRVAAEGGEVLARTVTLPLVPPDRWSFASMAYRPDASSIVVSLDGVTRGHDVSYPLAEGESHTGTGRIVRSDAPLSVGRIADDYFLGDLDEVKLSGFVMSDPYKITDMARLAKDGSGQRFEGTILFDSLGRLAPAQRVGLRVWLVRHRTVGTHERWVFVDPSGNVRLERQAAALPTPSPTP